MISYNDIRELIEDHLSKKHVKTVIEDELSLMPTIRDGLLIRLKLK